MKRFLAEGLAFLAIQLSILAILLGVYERRLGVDHYLAAFRDKDRRLHEGLPPRVLLVGGSSLAFGVNARAIERSLGRPVMNLGLNAGLGLEFVLRQAESALGQGDLLVLAPEYSLLGPYSRPDPRVLLQQLSLAPDAAGYVSARELPPLLDNALSPLSARLHALKDLVLHGPPNGIYRREGFDPRGDYVDHHGLRTQYARARHDEGIPSLADVAPACRRLRAFAERARALGAQVVLAPAPIPADDLEPRAARVEELWSVVARDTGIPVLQTERAYPRSMFLDTVYHLTLEGKRLRTRSLLAALRGFVDMGASAGPESLRMPVPAYDLIVIGSGPAGEKGAAQAAYFGKRVVLVEKEEHLGGAGVNTGTVPSKTLRETALYFSGLRQRGLYGIDYTVKQDITVPDFMYRKDEVVRSLWQMIQANVERHRIQVVRGAASFEDPHTVRVKRAGAADLLLSAPVILVATGSYPNWPEGVPKLEHLYDSDSILRVERIPRSLAVVGAGVIGCEYATIFRALGVAVTLVCGADRLLPFLDHEISERLRLQVQLLGLDVRLNDAHAGVEAEQDGVRLRLKSGEELCVEAVLFATGRMGATEGLGLERAGLTPGRRGHLGVNENYQTAVPHIYAAGDVVGFPALASTSMEQARVAMCHAFDLRYKSQVSPILPMAVYTIPEIAALGETEESCREKGIAYAVGRALYSGNSRGQIIGDLSGLVKLVFAPDDRRLLGVHVLGEMASELVHVGQGCLHFGGGIDYFIEAVFNYPTLAEAYKYAAYDGLGALARGEIWNPESRRPRIDSQDGS